MLHFIQCLLGPVIVAASSRSAKSTLDLQIVSNSGNKHLPHCPVIVATVETYAGNHAMTKRRWLTAATVASKTDHPVLPWQRGAKTRPAAFKHIQMHVAPRPKAIAAR